MDSPLTITRIPFFLKIAVGVAVSVFFLGGAVFGGDAALDRRAGRMPSQSTLGPLTVSHLTGQEVRAKVGEAVAVFEAAGLRFTLGGATVRMDLASPAPNDPGLYYTLIDIDVADSVERALVVAGQGGAMRNIAFRVASHVVPRHTPLVARVDEEKIISAIQENFGSFEQRATQTTFVPHRSGDETSFTVSPGVAGVRLDVQSARREVKQRVALLDARPIPLTLVREDPAVGAAEAEALIAEAEALVARPSFTLIGEAGALWNVPKEEFVQWLEPVKKDGIPRVGIARERVEKFLEPIAAALHIETHDAKFRIENGKVTEFQSSREGQALDRERTIENVSAAFLASSSTAAEIVVGKTAPAVALGDVNTLGIRELIGVGKTNFAGSPANRRHNINVGAASANGVIVMPGEEFSMVKTLGAVDGTTGYLPELVIKGTKTIPEYGGGLCQVSTTAFRATLDAGLPIVERTNHAYRVPYYEPPVGIDATIYLPKPDFKFLNDTGGAILILTRVEGDELIFEFWGSKDGRVVRRTEPKVFNFRPPPEKRIVETDELPPGKMKCTERAHTGADASFTYTVTYPDGRVSAQEFFSRYRPWGAVCLVGREKTAEVEAGVEEGADEGAAVSAEPPTTVE